MACRPRGYVDPAWFWPRARRQARMISAMTRTVDAKTSRLPSTPTVRWLQPVACAAKEIEHVAEQADQRDLEREPARHYPRAAPPADHRDRKQCQQRRREHPTEVDQDIRPWTE